MMLAFAIGAALAVQPAQTRQSVAASDFDLSPGSVRGWIPEPLGPLVPARPRHLDTRVIALDAPEAEWRVANGGPVVVVGAMGGRRSGMPKLAHVALDWAF